MDLKTAIYHYCNYQERAHSEVRNKLYELGATTPEVEELMADLVSSDLLNEERFARAYARGKFRVKRWGRIKITAALKGLRVSEYCIRKGLTEIDPEEYSQTLTKEARNAWAHYRSAGQAWKRRSKAHTYLLSRGYESGLVAEALANVEKE